MVTVLSQKIQIIQISHHPYRQSRIPVDKKAGSELPTKAALTTLSEVVVGESLHPDPILLRLPHRRRLRSGAASQPDFLFVIDEITESGAAEETSRASGTVSDLGRTL